MIKGFSILCRAKLTSNRGLFLLRATSMRHTTNRAGMILWRTLWT